VDSTLLPADTGSHARAAGAHTRASTKAGVGPLFMTDLLLANLATRGGEANRRRVRPIRPVDRRRSNRSPDVGADAEAIARWPAGRRMTTGDTESDLGLAAARLPD
jgi:hypothetical protein